MPEKARVVNLYRSIVVHVQTTAKREPYLFSIGDAAEEVIKRFQERQMETKEALKKLMDLAKKIASSEAERNSAYSGLCERTTSLTILLACHER
ncbi:hypothetical protein MUP05_10550 [Candidatus Bathyarchaeota archaeon]|nr:hypothetical protein [Candidatus Bathyarchaeota archaeon]